MGAGHRSSESSAPKEPETASPMPDKLEQAETTEEKLERLEGAVSCIAWDTHEL